jgi:hypothetical protein
LVLDNWLGINEGRFLSAPFCFGDTSPPGPLSKPGDIFAPEIFRLERG